ncbi:uncharacterized protein LOC108907076 isoform X2 [Anoplophora glabripennis]|uniref:uncharacterized protein LOC108907076 isoform X2 n=1 Tax=Anoplophora glabripennis TaxID=217634 RepID=UPI0008738B20|nr:uncharacterized protein LOC108907076 isoform X2 [Anoplophora glabripennis]
MSSKCFVPNCKNTVGVLFPEEPNLKKKWLEVLRIKDVNPNLTSFVCSRHFEDADLIDSEGLVKEGALPTKVAVSTTNNDKDVESKSQELCEDTAESHEQTGEVQVKIEACTAVEDEIDEEINKMPCENTSNGDDTVNCPEENSTDGDNCLTSKEVTNESVVENEESESPKTLVEPPRTKQEKKTCRLCAEEKSDVKNIFEEKIENVPACVAIMECIYPIEILKSDKLSKDICTSCLECINSYFKFRSVCLDNDKKQRDIHGEDKLILDDKSSFKRSSDQKRKAELSAGASSSKKLRVHEILSDSEDDYDDRDDLESLSDFLVKKNDPLESKPNFLSPPPLVPLPALSSRQAAIKAKFDKVEEELRRVLEGQLTEEQAKAENIIIHVENDDEQSPEKIATLSKLKLPIVIKPVETNRVKKVAQGVVSIWKNTERPSSLTTVKTGLKEEVNLPKCINITIKNNYKSEIGVFEGTSINYVYDVEFCQIDGYLFEYRLCKGTLRFLRCVLPACHALGVQNRIKPTVYSSEITVQRPHNHRRPDEAEKKKQMFYYVMKRKMQSDKTLNFRSVYDEVCKHDPEIKELVPLRNVINEICRHQLTYKIPPINSFDQFYNHVEDDAFQKLHFTHNGVQFYQERFTAEDDCKAVVFANADIVEQVSYGNLMYIDASFKIDTTEEFKYQLVTVLVWIEDSYYPILYALVNRKTQEIYKKIFEYLHDSLAPKLRPHEIVTDYEANLYYALGETYLDSAIGGSVFYYTQNLYKKICALNLSRDLETNSYFRNIYHMLLMLPLLPVNTILDGLNNMEIQARDLGLTDLTRPIFDHVRTEWIMKVTPDLFCVHRLESRINENVIAPFKKLRDFIMLSKGKMQRQHTTIVTVVEKLIELEHFLQVTYSAPNKKSFARDLSSSQKKNVLKAWQYIESHPKININNFFSKVLGYIKCMENQLWIWGFYRYDGDVSDDLINATNFSIVSNDAEVVEQGEDAEQLDSEYAETEGEAVGEGENGQLVMEAVIDENGGFVLQNGDSGEQSTPFENAFLKYVYKE